MTHSRRFPGNPLSQGANVFFKSQVFEEASESGTTYVMDGKKICN